MTSDRDYEEADALWEFVANPDQPPRDDVERAVRRVQGVVGPERTAQAMPRDRIWSEVVTSAATSPVRPSRAATGLVPAVGWTRRRVGRWSSVVSYGLMVAVVFSLLGIAHDRVMSPALATPAPELIASDFIATEGTPVAEDGCVGRDVTWEEPEFRADPRYEAVRPAPPEIGEAALETYIDIINCNQPLSFNPGTPAESAQAQAVKTLLTDRQWNAWFGTSSDTPVLNPDEAILQAVVIPLNRPPNVHMHDSGPGWSSGFEVFYPSEVYALVDGRFGVIIGTISSLDFQASAADRDIYGNGVLTWVAFVEQNGVLFIDEVRVICTGDWVSSDLSGQSSATPTADEAIDCR